LAVQENVDISKEKRNYGGRFGEIRRPYFGRQELHLMPMRTEIFWAAVVNFELPVQMCKNLRDGLPDSGEVFDGAAEPVQGAQIHLSENAR
jgi:hypothetical protein